MDNMEQGKFELVVDPIEERLEEISLLAEAWQKNRDRNRPSPMLRAAIIMTAKDLIAEVEGTKLSQMIASSESI